MALPPLVVLAELIPALMPTVRARAVPVPRPPRGSPVPGSAATIGTSRLPFSPSVPRNGPTDRYVNGFMGPVANLGPVLGFLRIRSVLDGCRWVKRAPRGVFSPAPRGVLHVE